LSGILPPLRPSPSGARCLPFRRVLFLLSRVDLLLESALALHNGYGILRQFAEVEPRNLAQALDPAPQLCSLLGTATVGRLLHAMHEDAEVAVGAVSANGFGSVTDGPSAEDRGRLGDVVGLAEWCPFGVREALEFLITGTCSNTVLPLTKFDLRKRSSLRLH